MSRKILINAIHPEEARIAIVEDGKLVELEIEIAGSEQIKGNIYKGAVVRVEPSLQAAFVDIGLRKLAFLQMGEIHPDNWQWREDIPEEQRKRRPRIQEVIRRGQELIVQVEKGERDMKGAALTTYISLPGRYIVLMPDNDSAGISRKVEGETERKKIRDMIADLEIPEGFGYIVRTEAAGRTEAELSKDLTFQLNLYEDIKIKGASAKAPELIREESELFSRTLRDYFTSETEEVLVDSKDALKEIKAFFKATMPKYEKLVKLHKEKRPIFSKYQIEEQIDHTYEKRVPLQSGGSIIIEPTEALVSIDVNSGKSTAERGVEETAYHTNVEAAEELARQLRLRDLGGLIVIDFIDMREKKHIFEVEKVLKNALKRDKARVTVGRISQFGIMEMSRQRIKQAIDQAVILECPHCSGRGKVKSFESMALSFLRKVHAVAAKGQLKEVHGELPLEVAYFLLNRKKRELARIEDDYEIVVTIKGKPSFLMNQLELLTVKREKHHDETPAPLDSVDTTDSTEPLQKDDTASLNQEESSIAPQLDSETASADEVEAFESEEPKKKKRRRGKRKKSSSETGVVELESMPEEAASADAEEIADLSSEDQKIQELLPAAETSDTAFEDEQPSELGEEEEKKKKRRRRRKKKKVVVSEESGDETVSDSNQSEDISVEPETESAEVSVVSADEPAGKEPVKKPSRRRSSSSRKKKEPQEEEESPSDNLTAAEKIEISVVPEELILPPLQDEPVDEKPVKRPSRGRRSSRKPPVSDNYKDSSLDPLTEASSNQETLLADKPKRAPRRKKPEVKED